MYQSLGVWYGLGDFLMLLLSVGLVAGYWSPWRRSQYGAALTWASQYGVAAFRVMIDFRFNAVPIG